MYVEMESLEEMFRLLKSIEESISFEIEQNVSTDPKAKNIEIKPWIFVFKTIESFETGFQRFNIVITTEDPSSEDKIIYYVETGKLIRNPEILDKYKADADKENTLMDMKRKDIIQKFIDAGYSVFLGRLISK